MEQRLWTMITALGRLLFDSLDEETSETTVDEETAETTRGDHSTTRKQRRPLDKEAAETTSTCTQVGQLNLDRPFFRLFVASVSQLDEARRQRRPRRVRHCGMLVVFVQ